jgi:hypothetical protein
MLQHRGADASAPAPAPAPASAFAFALPSRRRSAGQIADVEHAALIQHLHSADQIRRTLSLASLDSLLVLSQNHGGERAKLIEELSRRGKGFVWRDEDEQRLFPRDSERAGVLAAKRGLRGCDSAQSR